jgi:hypothetical protein
MHLLARHIARKELLRDARLIESVADAPTTIQGMRLTRFDKAMVYNRKLLQTVYWGTTEHFRETPDAPPLPQCAVLDQDFVCSEMSNFSGRATE